MLRTFLCCAALALVTGLVAGPAHSETSARQADIDRIQAMTGELRGKRLSRVEREVMEADLAFSADARKLGVGAAFKKWATADAKMVSGVQNLPTGPAAIAAEFGDSKAEYWWTPTEVHASGSVGATLGEAVIFAPTPDGGERTIRTRYITVWRKTPDGWRYVLDMGAPIRE